MPPQIEPSPARYCQSGAPSLSGSIAKRHPRLLADDDDVAAVRQGDEHRRACRNRSPGPAFSPQFALPARQPKTSSAVNCLIHLIAPVFEIERDDRIGRRLRRRAVGVPGVGVDEARV